MSDSDDYEVEEPILADDDPMRAFMPTSFGKKSKEANIARQIDQSKRQVATQPTATKKPASDRDDDSDSDDSDSDDSEDEEKFPVSHELVLKTHERAVTSVSVDPAGSRLLTGSLDCTLKLHDFSAMTPTTLRAFRSVDPWETKKSAASSDSHPIQLAKFSLSGRDRKSVV